ncbi:MAG: outer membrane beta-barrel protein [Proteobacteria bacterium]|nr:outer membrane beta-barrel protein [Pseudomonadota bacterium]
MTISMSRVQFIWSPLLGWALLTCSASLALAQVGSALPGVTVGPVAPAGTTTTGDQTTGQSGRQPADPNTPANSGIGTGGTLSGTPDSTTPVPTVTAPPAIPLPPGTTVQNPSTQLIPGMSDTLGGPGLTGGGVGVAGISGGASSGDEMGITMGSFRLYPGIDITTGYDSNVFAQNASAGTTASLSTVIQPTLALRSEWLNHSINLLMGGGFGFYQSAPTQNYQNYFMIVDGRIDIREDWTLTYSGGYRRATEALGTPNVAFAQAPTVDESIPISLSTTKRFNRVALEAGASATRAWFTDNSVITSSGLDALSRNRMTYEEHFNLSYEFSDDITLSVGPSFTQTKYDQTVDSLGQNRNSSAMGLNVGGSWAINPTSRLAGSVGYTINSSEGGLGATSAYVFNLGGSWDGIRFLTLRPALSRSISETALSAYRNTVSTVLGMDFTYEINPEWAMTGGLSYTMSEYNPIDGLGATPRTDTFTRASLGLLYMFRPQLSIGPVFDYTKGGSTDSTGPAYDRQLFSIRLSAKR